MIYKDASPCGKWVGARILCTGLCQFQDAMESPRGRKDCPGSRPLGVGAKNSECGVDVGSRGISATDGIGSSLSVYVQEHHQSHISNFDKDLHHVRATIMNFSPKHVLDCGLGEHRVLFVV
jgi:hypothetical protein